MLQSRGKQTRRRVRSSVAVSNRSAPNHNRLNEDKSNNSSDSGADDSSGVDATSNNSATTNDVTIREKESSSPASILVAASPSPTTATAETTATTTNTARNTPTPTPIDNGNGNGNGNSNSNGNGNSSNTSKKMLYDTRIKRKNVLALNEKVAALREYEKVPVYKHVGRLFHCSPDQIKRIVQQKDAIREAWEQRTRRSQDAKTLDMKMVRVSMLGKAVYEWIRRMMYYQDIQLTDGLLQKTALQFKSAMGLQNFFPHQDWCDKFRQTYKITEVDSKLLKIGYTQGHSVQIKDVMKDVMNECTPDTGNQSETSVAVKDENENEMQTEQTTLQKDKDKDGQTTTKRARSKAAGSNASTTTPTASIAAAQCVSPKPLPQLQNIRQLVALPLQGNRMGMPQKVLVATPITPAGQVGGTTPMTMTIIPLATIAKSQSMQAATAASTATSTATCKVAATAAEPAAGAATTTAIAAARATSTAAQAAASVEKQIMPTPIVEIKKEIKEEPEEEQDTSLLHIKQEFISDDDGLEDYVQQLSDSDCSTTASTMQRQCNGNTNNANNHGNIDDDDGDAGDAGDDDTHTSTDSEQETVDDDDNMALANLRRLIQTQGTIVATPTTRTAASYRQTAKQQSAEMLPAITIIPRRKSAATDSRAARTKTTQPMQATTTTKTITTTTAATILPLPPLTKAPEAVIKRLASKRKAQLETLPMMPPIKSCTEARKHLKLLEDFALYKENFQLIGLITRADEVLREMDGDDDVDVD